MIHRIRNVCIYACPQLVPTTEWVVLHSTCFRMSPPPLVILEGVFRTTNVREGTLERLWRYPTQGVIIITALVVPKIEYLPIGPAS